MTFPPPAPGSVLAYVRTSTYHPDEWGAACPCTLLDSPTCHNNPHEAINAAHSFAIHCPLAKHRLDIWRRRRRQRETVT